MPGIENVIIQLKWNLKYIHIKIDKEIQLPRCLTFVVGFKDDSIVGLDDPS